jgi:hypothetical protein
MRETGIGTSLILIAGGAVLAFAVQVNSTAIDVSAIGAILMVVGIIGLLFSFIALGDWSGWRSDHHTHVDDRMTPPHEHRRVERTDVVYEDDAAPRTERVDRVIRR